MLTHSMKERTNALRDVELTLNATTTFIPSKKLVMVWNGVFCTKIVVKEEFQPVMEELLERQVLQFHSSIALRS